ncbi:MAG: hypothetical protein WC516_05080 [Patescibacteria group bacterium]
MAKTRKYDRIKALKKASRDTQQPHGKAGIHCDKRERRQHKMSTQDYIDEAEDNIPFWMDGGPGESLLDEELEDEVVSSEDKENEHEKDTKPNRE